MKRGDPGPFCRSSKKSLYPFSHLIGRLIGEGDRENVPGLHPFFFNKISNSVSQDSGLSTSRTCKHQEWSLGFQNRLLLNRIEIVEQRHRIKPSVKYKMQIEKLAF